ncbi:hypothetical protein FRC17_004761, partial [Serendipita sp. 399]
MGTRGCKRRAEDHHHVQISKKQRIQSTDTTVVAHASTSTTVKKVFPIFDKAAQIKQQKSDFRFVERLGHGTVLHGIHLEPTITTTATSVGGGGGGGNQREPVVVKVAAFDLDGTLIRTKNNNGRSPFPSGATDWRWWHASVPSRLKQVHKAGYYIVIISNQGGLSTSAMGSKRREQWERKIGLMAKELPDIPFHILAATEDNKYRKPQKGMWTCIVSLLAKQEGIPDLDASFYVGDAAGRPGDHSDCDKGFAEAVGIQFHTPE